MVVEASAAAAAAAPGNVLAAEGGNYRRAHARRILQRH